MVFKVLELIFLHYFSSLLHFSHRGLCYRLKSPAGDRITHELLYSFLFELDGFFHLCHQNGQCFTEMLADGEQEGCQLILMFQQQQEEKKKKEERKKE